jgi:low temperature requirement protein LtrA
MTMANWRWRDIGRAPAGRVTTVEVFFDLVFVFTLTQLTRILEADLSLRSGGQVLLLFGLLWWMFSGYVWLANHVPPRTPPHKLVLFCGMTGFLIAAVGIPLAFSSTGLVFGIGYLVVISVHLILFTQADIDRAVLGRLAAYNLASAALVVLGGSVDGRGRYALWLAALVVQSVVPSALPRYSWMGLLSSFHVVTDHFIERFGLLVIIALGESVVAIGVGAEDLGTTVEELVAAALALAIVCMLWWAYFDLYALVAERKFREAVGVAQLRIARDSYALLHFLLIAGIVLFALGVKKLLEHPEDPLKDMPVVALCGGLAVYALGMVAFRMRNTGTVARARIVTAALCLALVPVAMNAPGLAALSLLAAAWVGLIAYETLRYREFRASVRSEYAAH